MSESGARDGVERHVGSRDMPAGSAHTVRLRRTYDSPMEDVWDACTNPERVARWFLPLTGELRLGGRYQLQGNAGGTILLCDAPRALAVTWEFGAAPPARVELRLSAGAGGATVLELEHVGVGDANFWTQYGPGSVGVGWDLALLGLAKHLHREVIEDGPKWMGSPEGRAVIVASCRAWGAAHAASGADPAAVAAAVEQTIAFYTGGTGGQG